MSHVAAPSDKRFRRAHVKPARKRKHWSRWSGRSVRYAVLSMVLAYGVYRGAGLVAQAHVLQIDHIAVVGNEHLSNGDVLAVLSGLRGQSLLWADLDAWRHRLLSSPWVREANLRRSLPSTIEVVVAERQPSGIGRIGSHLYLIDDRGVVIDEYGPQYADFDLPVIDGLPAPSDDGTTDAARMDLAARLIGAVAPKPEIANRLSQIDVRDPHNATVILSGDAAVLQLGDEQFLRRLQSYLELAPTLYHRLSDIDRVDLRFDNRVYVRPSGKTLASNKFETAGVTSRAAAPDQKPKRKARR
jgi:cell division protein FtsQ